MGYWGPWLGQTEGAKFPAGWPRAVSIVGGNHADRRVYVHTGDASMEVAAESSVAPRWLATARATVAPPIGRVVSPSTSRLSDHGSDLACQTVVESPFYRRIGGNRCLPTLHGRDGGRTALPAPLAASMLGGKYS
jgi:hypothetical protein